jgi:AraC-like DNA-binding protein
MRPYLEHVSAPSESSWVIFDRRLPRIPFEWHYHPEYELTLTLKSRGQRFVGDNVSPYEHGDLVLLGPKIPHTWCSGDNPGSVEEQQAIVVWFTEKFVRSMIQAHVELHGILPLLEQATRGVKFSESVRARAEVVIRAMLRQMPGTRLASLLTLFLLLSEDRETTFLCSLANQMVELPSATEERIGRVISHLHRHYRDEIPIEGLARLGALSRSSLHRLFRQQTRLTIHEYIAQLRIGNACALLLNTRRPVSVIADEVGYRNLANFNRQFKALKGQTPRAFRSAFRG